ncbi:MAG: ISLre2 family transposase [Enterococcus cecorum]|nr:ISLre2 family transposase [Enterococcus cecorum]
MEETLINTKQLIENDFLMKIKQIENQKASELLASGWKYIKTATRTVIFTFGEMTFSRRCYKKGSEYFYPVDQALGLIPYARYSMEICFLIAKLATQMTYRAVASTIEETKGIHITKDTVLKVRKMVDELYAAKDEFELLKDEEIIKRKKVDKLYIEGDGVIVKTPLKDEKNRTELAHFVIHEGVEKKYNRNTLINKHEIISSSNKAARKLVLDYLYNTYEFDENSLIITNSDMGKGYTAYTFKELVKTFGCKHEHFYDEYHVNDSIKRIFKNVPVLKNKAIEAIKTHSHKNLKTVFDTFESMITDEKILQRFWDISKRILTNFQYTLPARKRGFSHEGIGIMESQHCKISNRMKHRKMKWSIKGAETMARMIIDIGQNKLDDLFFGEWRGGYIKMQLKGFSAAKSNVYPRGKKNIKESAYKIDYNGWIKI